jgi:hypothetical protein
MDALKGNTTYREIYIEDLGKPITGASLTYAATGPTGSSLSGIGAVSDLSNGWYRVTLDGGDHLATAGLYTETWSGTASSLDYRQVRRFIVGDHIGSPIQRWELRHRIAARLGDLKLLGVATSATASTLVDSGLTYLDDDQFNRMHLYIYGGTGADQARVITDFVSSTGTFTPNTNWTSTPDSTSRYEVHQLFSVEEYNRAINEAIDCAAWYSLVTVLDETISQTTNTYEYQLPQELVYLQEVWQQDSTVDYPEWTLLPRDEFEYQVFPGRKILKHTRATTNYKYRLIGQILPTHLTRDYHWVDISPRYLVPKACALLLEGKITGPQSDREAYGNRVSLFHNEAEAMRPGIKPLKGSVRL